MVAVTAVVLLYLAASRGRLLPAFWRLPSPHPRPAETREGRWQQDLNYLARELPRLHVDGYHTLSKPEFERAVQDLSARLPTLSDRLATLELVRLVARFGDAHTRAIPAPSDEEHLLPVRLYWFADGIYVVDAMPGAEQTIGSRLVRIGESEIERACAAIEPLISHETELGYKNRVTLLVLSPELLVDLGLAQDGEEVPLLLEDPTGAQMQVNLHPVPSGEYERFFGDPEHVLPVDEQPLYRTHPDLYYWFEVLPQERALYFQYDRCAEQEGRPLDAFYDELFAAIEAGPVERLIVDLRLNGGGSSTLLGPFVRRLAEHPLNQEGKLYVMIGRGTFSSAVLNALQLKQETEALFVGEPTAGSANHYGEIKRFVLPNSGMRVQYSTKYFGTGIYDLGPMNAGDYLGAVGYSSRFFPVSESKVTPVMPDLQIAPTGADHFAGRDPALEAVLDGMILSQ
jgi:hypothetical protein